MADAPVSFDTEYNAPAMYVVTPWDVLKNTLHQWYVAANDTGINLGASISSDNDLELLANQIWAGQASGWLTGKAFFGLGFGAPGQDTLNELLFQLLAATMVAQRRVADGVRENASWVDWIDNSELPSVRDSVGWVLSVAENLYNTNWARIGGETQRAEAAEAKIWFQVQGELGTVAAEATAAGAGVGAAEATAGAAAAVAAGAAATAGIAETTAGGAATAAEAAGQAARQAALQAQQAGQVAASALNLGQSAVATSAATATELQTQVQPQLQQLVQQVTQVASQVCPDLCKGLGNEAKTAGQLGQWLELGAIWAFIHEAITDPVGTAGLTVTMGDPIATAAGDLLTGLVQVTV